MNASEQKADLTEDRLFPVAWGIVHCVVCAPKDWSADRISDEKTRADPPGTSVNRWVVSEPRERSDQFNGVNQLPCPDDPNRIHWLMNC